MTQEFALIKQYFAKQPVIRPDVNLGIGDDAAVVNVPEGQQLVITTDTLISGVHFPEHTSAYDIGHKALAVNLSDLAAMGATPAWVTLALSIPNANDQWLEAFTQGFFTLAKLHKVQLIGGDTTRSSLSATVTAFGFVPKGQAITRANAQPGDLIYVSNNLGDGGLALRLLRQKIPYTEEQKKVLQHFKQPEPQIQLGERLRGIANAAIDISDGLAADLGHILEQSKVGAIVNVDQLPLSSGMLATLPAYEALDLALTGGDDYQLCFTVPLEKKSLLDNLHVTQIGVVTEQPGLLLQFKDGKKYEGPIQGYQHF